MTDIQDQGECGACWSFSAVAALEAALFLAGGGDGLGAEEREQTTLLGGDGLGAEQQEQTNGAEREQTHLLTKLSEQEVISCDAGNGDMNCQGGHMDTAFDWVARQGLCASDACVRHRSRRRGTSGPPPFSLVV